MGYQEIVGEVFPLNMFVLSKFPQRTDSSER